MVEEALAGEDANKGLILHSDGRFIFAEKDESMNLRWNELKPVHQMMALNIFSI